MSFLQSSIGPITTIKIGSGFPPSSGTPIDNIVMSSTSFTFEWNQNSGVSATHSNPTRSVNSLSEVPFFSGSNVAKSFPFLGGSHPLGVSLFPELVMSLMVYIFWGMPIFLGSLFFLGEIIL